MSKENLPEKINPFRLAEAGASLRVTLQLKDMQRLRTSLANDDGEVEVEIQFGIDQQGTRFLRGHINTQLILQCQRCMDTFVYGIIDDFLLGVVKTEEAAKELPEMYEPIFAEDGMLVTQDIIEDELIVGLPIVPMHKLKDCKVESPTMVLGSDEKLEKDNPFQVIEILRTKRDTNRNQE
jgi:uncharacterized protein